MKRLLVAALLLAPAALAAQATDTARRAGPPANLQVAMQRGLWRTDIRYLTTAAEEWPEADYSWKPVGTVRSFGQMIAHVAGSQYGYCARALGENRDADEARIEKTATTKAAIVAELKASTEYCDKAYNITDAQAAKAVNVYGSPANGLYAIASNAIHNAEHYGSIITYMRLKGMVPPSSRPRSGQ